MQDRPLLIPSLLRHAAAVSPHHEIVSLAPGPSAQRLDFMTIEERSRALAQALVRFGIGEGDRVASLAWNTHRHLELFYGVPGCGAVLHTVNPRYSDEQIAYIVNHAGDRVLFFDPDLAPLVARLAPRLETVEHYVMLGTSAERSDAGLDLTAYEDLLGDGDFTWPSLDERAAALLCYTSGTTGHPKGVLTSHRSNVIHALAAQSACAFGLTPLDSVLLIVPMFHAYGWGIPYVAALSGAKLVLPGPTPTPATCVRLIGAEAVSLAMGVPTVWNGILDHLDAVGGTLRPLKRALVGGSAVPPGLARRLTAAHGLELVTGWGMTELSPLGSFTGLTPAIAGLDEHERESVMAARAGRLLYPLEARIVGPDGRELPWNGHDFGDVQVRGPCVASAYFGQEATEADAHGWFPTGDIGTIDCHGTIAITDRSKDLIKSGGEWISSADIERAAASVASVETAAAIAVEHPKWQERPLLLLVPRRGKSVDLGAVRAALASALPSWQQPDDILIVDAIPLTATGKIDKKQLRAIYGAHLVRAAGVDATSMVGTTI